MSGPEYDEEFEAYLRRRVRLDRRLPRSLSRLEPPADLDRIVLGMAREAIQPLPNAPLFRAPRWAVPLAMAASVLVSFSLMLEVGLRPATRALSSAPLVVELSNPAPAPAAPPRPESAPAPSALAAAAPRPSVSGVARQRTALSRVAPWHRATSSPPPALPAAPSNGSFSSAAVAGRAAPPAGIPSLTARSSAAKSGTGCAPGRLTNAVWPKVCCVRPRRAIRERGWRSAMTLSPRTRTPRYLSRPCHRWSPWAPIRP
jgi:hypothetical protein